MLKELEDYMIASPSNAIEYVDNRLTYLSYRPGRYYIGSKSIFPTLQFSHAMFTIHNLVYQITFISVIDVINDIFSLINNISQSFGILKSVKEIYELNNQEHLPVNSTIKESKIQKTKIFGHLDEGYY